MLAVVHSVLFWAGNVVLTPLILLATLFPDRKRTVHDLLLGTVVVRTRPLSVDAIHQSIINIFGHRAAALPRRYSLLTFFSAQPRYERFARRVTKAR